MAGICGSHYLLLAELGQNTEETGEGSAGALGRIIQGLRAMTVPGLWSQV